MRAAIPCVRPTFAATRWAFVAAGWGFVGMRWIICYWCPTESFSSYAPVIRTKELLRYRAHGQSAATRPEIVPEGIVPIKKVDVESKHSTNLAHSRHELA